MIAVPLEVAPRRRAPPPVTLWAFCLVLLRMLLGMQAPRLALNSYTRPPVSPKRARRFMIFNFRAAYVESATVLTLTGVLQQTYRLGANCFVRAVHIHLIFGVSKGLALVTILSLVMAQAAASLVLTIPTLYFTTGSIFPAAVLAFAIWLETVLFGDVYDGAFALRVAAQTAALAMLALFRYDRQARDACAQLPTDGRLLSVEAACRRACTAARVGVFLPPVAVVLLLWATFIFPFWSANGLLHEFYRARHQATTAVAALLLAAAGQDTRAGAVLGDALERVVDRALAFKEDLLGQPRVVRFLGRKKSL